MKKLSTLLLISVAPMLGLTAQTFPSFDLTRNFWTSPTFVQEFMGTYGFNGEQEPKVNQDEGAIFQQVIPLVQAGQEQQAINLLQANTTGESSAAFDFTLGNLYLQTGQNSRAERAYLDALRKFPNFMNAQKNLGSLYVQQGKYKEATDYLIRTIELGGGSGVLYGVLGYSYLNLQKFASAENAYRNALLLQPDSKDWKNGLIQSLNAQRKHEELVGVLNEVISENQNNADYWMFQANAFVALERHQEAIANLEILDRMNVAPAKSLMLLGDLYMREGVPSAALTAYQKSLQKGGNIGNNEFIRASEILLGQGNYEQAEDYITQILEQREDSLSSNQLLDLYNLQSEIYLATGESDKAAETLENILEQDPLNGPALLNLGEYYWRNDDRENAELMYERAQKLEDYEVEALVQHARLLVDLKEFGEAVDLLRRVVLLDNSERYQKYLEAVERAAEVSA